MRFLLAFRGPPLLVLLASALAFLGPTVVRSQQPAPAPTSPPTAANLPPPGYCPPNADLACPALLEAYGRAYRELFKRTQDYYTVLGAAFDSALWIERAGAQSKELASDFARVKTKAENLGPATIPLGGKLYVDRLQDALTEKGKYERARKVWIDDPLIKKKRDDLATAETAYFDALREAYARADGFAAYPDAVGAIAQEAEAIAKALRDIQTKLKQPPELGRFAEEMRRTQQQQAAGMASVFAAAEAAAKAAVLAGAKLEHAPESAGAARNVVILDALYGSSVLMATVMARWKKAQVKTAPLKDLLPWERMNTSGREDLAPFCYASDYVKAACLYSDSREKLCLHKDAATNPEKLHETPTACDPTKDMTIPVVAQQRVLKKKDVSACSFGVFAETICGGLDVNVPAADRHALILYRCGQDPPDLRLAASNKQVYLFCN